MHFLVAGYYGFRNNGDEAILQVLLKDLQSAASDVTVCVQTGNPDSTRRYYQVDTISHTDVVGMIDQAYHSDALVLGGGGLFQDYWGAKKEMMLSSKQAGLPFYSTIPLLGRLLDKPVLIYSVGVGPLFSQEAKELTRQSFEYASAATVRDEGSLKQLNQLGFKNHKVKVTSDPAFTLQPDIYQARKIFGDMEIDTEQPIVGVCLRSWDIGVSPSAWQFEVASALDVFSRRTGCQFIFVPFQDSPDTSLTCDSFVANQVLEQMQQRQNCKLLLYQEDPTVTAGILSFCKLVLGMRYHSLVFSAISNIPMVALSYDAKVSQLMLSLGLGDDVIQLPKLSREGLISMMARAWERSSAYRQELADRVAVLKNAAGGNSKMVCDHITKVRFSSVHPHISTSPFLKDFTLQQARILYQRDNTIENLLTKAADQEKVTREMQERLNEQKRTILDLKQTFEADLREKEKQILLLEDQMNAVTRSRAWKLNIILWNTRKRLIPQGSRREQILRTLWHNLRKIQPTALKSFFQPPFPFNNRYIEEDNSQVTLYSDDPQLLPGFRSRRSLRSQLPDTLRISLITSVRNEIGNARKWMGAIQNQSRPPDEIVLLDGGSTDGTVEQLEEWIERAPFPVRVIRSPGTNIARGRNIAIQAARFPIIAITDFGCEPKQDWLEKLVRPFIVDPETRVSAGFYECINHKGKVLNGNRIWPSVRKIDPQSFLPSSRSVAFCREALDSVGGHPEWLSKTGDDTYLDLELKRLGGKWAFVPDAQVRWLIPEGLPAYLQKMYQWASGDGESGVHAHYYWRYFLGWMGWFAYSLIVLAGVIAMVRLHFLQMWLWLGMLATVWLLPALILMALERISPIIFIYKSFGQVAHVLGFLNGAGRVRAVEQRRLMLVKGWFFILSGVPIDDSGGGARGTQITLELLNQGYGVVFIHEFPKDESKVLDLKFTHPNLLRFPISSFDLDRLRASHPALFDRTLVTVLLEFPLPNFLVLARRLRDQFDAKIVYDLLDDWATSLGGNWYDPQVEQQIVEASDLQVAILPHLARRVEVISGKKCLVLPNAVNHHLFDRNRVYPRPVDLPNDRRILIYVGALWGEWLDWQLLQRLASHYPQDALVVIGDYRGQYREYPENLYFLGLKPQSDLPAYLSYADLALIPWKVGAITQATSPLKVYEYLAMGLPVLAPHLEPLRSIPGVTLAKDREEFILLAGSLSKNSFEIGQIDAFINENTWQERVRLLLETLRGIKTDFT